MAITKRMNTIYGKLNFISYSSAFSSCFNSFLPLESCDFIVFWLLSKIALLPSILRNSKDK